MSIFDAVTGQNNGKLELQKNGAKGLGYKPFALSRFGKSAI